MTQSLDLNKMGLAPMDEFEMQEVEGGGFWKWCCIIGAAVLAVGLTIGTGGLALVAAEVATGIANVGACTLGIGAAGLVLGGN